MLILKKHQYLTDAFFLSVNSETFILICVTADLLKT
jgi:hypothetical protein